MISAIISRIVILLFGTLYPAYASYKAIRTRNVKEYVKWMMYWIVFALFSSVETVTDIFLSWFPFYYEVKVIIVIWLLSPATKGSSTLYRKFVHPMLTRREEEIDEYINQAKEKGYSTFLQLGSKGVNYATNVIMQTALKTLPLTITQSDEAHITPPDEHDAVDGGARVVNSPSVDLSTIRGRRAISRGNSEALNYYEGSSGEDELMIIDHNDFGGSARSRDPPQRKTRAKTQKGRVPAAKHTRKNKKIVELDDVDILSE